MVEPIEPGEDTLWARWEEVDRLFDAVLDVPPADRERFIVQACKGDLELLRALRELIGITDSNHKRLPGPGPALMRAVWSDSPLVTSSGLEPGRRVGHYRIVSELGRGGMATVYEAERADGTFERRVALKVVRRGVDTDDVIGRFLAERQILSGLTHPNIARLLDGGTTEDGRPFLVIDLVDGQPIDRYSKTHELAVHERLRLFLQVVEAVQYAHRRLVVHRDLKPSNILVTPDGHAKLLDFGIAKLLGGDGDDAPLTRLGVRALTPQYASPEQLRGDAITTASDVYQLGILLHVLLVGERPRDRGGDRGSEMSPLTGEFARPSQLVAGPMRRVLRGDLDTIVQRALREDAEKRYDSAQALGDDVRRHLDRLPIAARPPSMVYRCRKFVGRNRWFPPVAALALVGLSGFGVTRYQHGRQLERERNEARAQADRAEQIKEFMVGVFGSADPYAPADPERGREITVIEALAVGAARASADLADQPILRADLLSAIAGVYESLDQREPAIALLEDVLATRTRTDPIATTHFADEIGRYGNLLSVTGHPDSAESMLQRRIALERELHGEEHPRMADALSDYAYLFDHRGDHERALELRERAERILRLARPVPRAELGELLGTIADTYRALQRLDDADRASRQSAETLGELFGAEHAATAIARIHVAEIARDRGDLETAIRVYRETLPILDRVLGSDHGNTAASWNNYALALVDAGEYAEAEQVHLRLLDLRRRVRGGEDDRDVAAALQNLAALMARLGRWSEAESYALEAREIYEAVTVEGHYLRAFPLLTVAESRLMRDDGVGAEQAMRSALPILRAALPAGHYATAVAECRLGAALVLQGRVGEAAPLVRAALDLLESSEQTPRHYVDECAGNAAALEGSLTRR